MNVEKDKNNSLIQTNSLNGQNLQKKSFFNPEKNNITQDLLYFKNDVLKDIRKLEEKLSLKLTAQNLMSSEQFENFEKKLDELSNYISKVHSLVLDTNEITEQIKNFGKFKTKTEDNFNRINLRISLFQKEYKDYSSNIEKLVNENLRYPGIIGRNSKFLNFRYFIDFILKNFKEVNEFKDEVRDFEINDFKKKVNSDISDFRFAINDNYQNSIRLIGNTFKEFDEKIADLIKRNDNNMKKNEEKFEEIKNNINNYFSEYQTKFESLEKILNDKFKEQLNEMEKFKSIKEELVANIDNFKLSMEEQKKEIISKNNNIEKHENSENIINDNSINNNTINNNINNINNSNNNNSINNNITNGINNNITNGINNNINDNNKNDNNKNDNNMNDNKELNFLLNSRNINFQTILSREKRNLLIELLNDINALDEYQNSEEKNNIDSSLNERIHSLHIERSMSFDKTQRNFIDENNELKIFQHKKKLDNNINIFNKDIIRSNYSISNIPNIKIKKVHLPEHLVKINLNQTARAFHSKYKGLNMMQNNISPVKSKKNIDFNDIFNNNEKKAINIPKMNKNKESKNKIMKLTTFEKEDEKKPNLQLNKNMSSLLIIKPKTKNILKNIENLKKNKKKSWSFECEKNLKDQKVQIGFRKTFNIKNRIKEIILMNSKNLKKTRKIEL